MLNQATSFNLPFNDTLTQQKVPLSKISDDVIACDLWFGPLPVKNPSYAYEASLNSTDSKKCSTKLARADMQFGN